MNGALGTLVVLLGLLGADEAAANPPSGATDPVRSALGKGDYPWYDAPADTAKPIWPPREFNWDFVPDWKLPGGGSLGSLLVYLLAALAFAVLCGVLIWLWRQHLPEADEVLRHGGGIGSARRLESLPAGLRPETDDPWSEALRRRQQGNYEGAIICLFAHQLLTLERLRQIRLVPGKTGRQLVRAVDNPRLHACVESTLLMFESVYYGHQAISAQEFEAVWARAEEFERITRQEASA